MVGIIRGREAIEKERKKQEYQRLHALGKTDEAQADLARLQIIRKQREEAAKKREEEKLAKEKAGKEQQTSKLAGGVANMKL
uniref:Casein kinase substrate phosphoprotein PP28 domain-containing protein n=1 Tax=Romanomermis culicivorax TaxID=13658 RepID=A0A915HGK8_ROMCU